MNSSMPSLNDPNLPDVSVPSHRAALGMQLASAGTRTAHPMRRLALGVAAVCFCLFALSIAYPSWAKDLVRFVKTGERTVHAPNGSTYHQETYRMDPSHTGTGTVRLQVGADGKIISHTEQEQTDPALQAMHDEAERIVQSGKARLLFEDSGMRFYQATLADGRTITYTQGPGTSWSISQ